MFIVKAVIRTAECAFFRGRMRVIPFLRQTGHNNPYQAEQLCAKQRNRWILKPYLPHCEVSFDLQFHRNIYKVAISEEILFCTIFSYHVKYAFPCFKTGCKICHLKYNKISQIFISLVSFSLLRQIVTKLSFFKELLARIFAWWLLPIFLNVTKSWPHVIETRHSGEGPFIYWDWDHSPHTWLMEHLRVTGNLRKPNRYVE